MEGSFATGQGRSRQSAKAYAASPPGLTLRGAIFPQGEPPTIGTAAAIGNAVTNAVGVRVGQFPMSPMNVLNAIATASKNEGKA